MEKTKSFRNAYFAADIIRHVLDRHVNYSHADDTIEGFYKIDKGDEEWEFDDEIEYFAEYRKAHASSFLKKSNSQVNLKIRYVCDLTTTISVQAKTRGQIENVFETFENTYPNSIIEAPKMERDKGVFIGHGRSFQWRDLKDHLSDLHGYKIEAYETGARAGRTIVDILASMTFSSRFAILVMTGEDMDDQEMLRARQNVIHEIGLFQGKLGFEKTIVLLEKGTEEFSNISGVHQIRYSKDNIKETFGEVLATLRRELY